MDSSDIIETLSGELANASLAEQLGSNTHQFFVILGASLQPVESPSGMSPTVESVSKEGRRVLAQCISHLSEMRTITQNAAFTVQKILSDDLNDGQQEENTIVLRERILKTFADVGVACKGDATGNFEEWRDAVRDFQDDHVVPCLEEMGKNVNNLMNEQKTKRINRNDVNNIDTLKAGDPWTALAGFVTNVPIKKFVRFMSGRLGKEIIAIQKKIDTGKDEMIYVKTMDKQADLALKCLEEASVQWQRTQRDIWGVIGVGVIETLKEDSQVTRETREHLRHNMNMIVKELSELYHQINKSWNAVNAAYGGVPCMTREVCAFRTVVTGVSDRLKQLFSIVEIVRDTHTKDMHKLVRALGMSLAGRLEKLWSISSEWILRLDDGFAGTSLAMIPMAGDILTQNCAFHFEARRICNEIRNILDGEISSRKSRRAVAIQKEEVQVDNLLSRSNERRAATSDAALDAVGKMEKTLDGISKFSTQLGMGMLFYRHESYSDLSHKDTQEAASETFPLDPYTVDEGLLIDLSYLLSREIHGLKRGTEEKISA